MKIISLLSIFTVPLVANPNPVIRPYSYLEVDEVIPKRFPENVTLQNFENEFIRKEGNVFVVLYSVQTVSFSCEADYPIRWSVPFPQQFKGLESQKITIEARGGSILQNLKETREPIFKDNLLILKLQIRPNSFLSGNFTCEAINSSYAHKTSSGIYVFTQGAKLQGLGSILHINLSKPQHSNKFVLPCRVASPELEVNLFKANSNSSFLNNLEEQANQDFPNVTWLPFPSGALKDVKNYFPMIGFILNAMPRQEAVGLYKCSLKGEPDLTVYVDVHTGDAFEQRREKFEIRKILKWDNATAMVTNDRKDFACCRGSTDSDPPLSSFFSCESENYCDIWKVIWVQDINLRRFVTRGTPTHPRSNCFTMDLPNHSELITCQSPNEMDVMTQIISVFHEDNGNATLGNRTGENWKNALVWSEPRHIYELSSEDGPSLEEKITFRLATKLINSKYRLKFNLQNIAFVFHSGGNEQRFPGANEEEETEEDNESEEVMYLTSHSDQVYEGEDLYIICYHLKYYYARWGWLRLKWKNGTETYLPVDWNDDKSVVSYMGYIPEYENVLIGNIPKVTMEMLSVECMVQPWNARKWEVREFKLNVHPAVPPKFLDSGKTKTLKLDNKEDFGDGVVGWSQEFNCDFKETGKPAAVVKWKVDGMPLEKSMPALKKYSYLNHSLIHDKDGSHLKMNFLLAQSSSSKRRFVIFKCIARNGAGNDVKYFQIKLPASESSTALQWDSMVNSRFLGIILGLAVLFTILSLFAAVFIFMKNKLGVSLTSLFSCLGTPQQ